MDERIIELEVRVAYQDKIIEELDEVVQAFWKRLDKVEREFAEFKQTAREGTPEVGPADDPPPHY